MSTPYIGEIRLVAFSFAPVGWAFCNGQIMAIVDNVTLFNLIGTTYGGDGVNTFKLPDLQSRVPIHMGTDRAFGLTYVLAQTGGAETVTLTGPQIPIHTHRPQCKNAAADAVSPSGNFWGSWADNQFSDSSTNATLNAGAVSSVGGSQPHDNLVPFQVLNFIIALFGIYPSQN